MESTSNTLIFKNIPKQVDDVMQLLNSLKIPAAEIKPFGRKRALIRYGSEKEACGALEKLQNLEFNGKLVNVSWFCKDKSKVNNNNPMPKRPSCNKAVQTPMFATNRATSMEPVQISKYVKKLYATDEDLQFDQPPPPYLKYQYPPINRAILDNICISLLNNKKFYTQVLHLMNRMNLEPPFRQGKHKFVPKGEPKDVHTQTDPITIDDGKEQCIDSESEMESADEATCFNQSIPIPKRKLPPSDEQYKKRARAMLRNVKKLSQNLPQKSQTLTSKQDLFDAPSQKLQSSNIQLNISTAILKTQLATDVEESEVSVQTSSSNVAPIQTDTKVIPYDLTTNRIAEEEMHKLPVFKNYKQGEPSNKLYIKNLQKDVVTEDLKSLYQQIVQNDSVRLDIKVMQHGRMKGQAFVSFSSDILTALDLQKVVLEALIASNGYILRQKPLVVCFGKQT